MTKEKNIILDDIPEMDTPEINLKISKAILSSLKRKLLLTQQQERMCIDILNKRYHH